MIIMNDSATNSSEHYKAPPPILIVRRQYRTDVSAVYCIAGEEHTLRAGHVVFWIAAGRGKARMGAEARLGENIRDSMQTE